MGSGKKQPTTACLWRFSLLGQVSSSLGYAFSELISRISWLVAQRLLLRTGDQIRLSNRTVGPNDPSHKSGTIIRLSETEIRVSFEERFSLEGRDAGPYDR